MAEGRARRLVIAGGIYVVVVGTYFAVIPRNRILEHTPYNHFSLLAEAWLHHRLDLGNAPPPYAQNNDFAAYGGKWFVTFPPFPAVLLVPFVLWGKTAENVRDGQVFLWLSGLGPAALFLALEKLRRVRASVRTPFTNAVLALLFAFGSVYFFTAIQGSVWFAAHIVGAGVGAFYLLFALDAERPLLAGLMIGFGFLTRTPLLFAAPLFVFEASRVALGPSDVSPTESHAPRAPTPMDASQRRRSASRQAKVREAPRPLRDSSDVLCWCGLRTQSRAVRQTDGFWLRISHRRVARPHAPLGALRLSLPRAEPRRRPDEPFHWYEVPRAVPSERTRTRALGHYSALPVAPLAEESGTRRGRSLRHGRRGRRPGALLSKHRLDAVRLPLLERLRRLSYSRCLAVTGHRFGKLFWALAASWSIAVNPFGAATFDRGEFKKRSLEDASQRIFYEND